MGGDRGGRNVKNLDYKNASSGTVTNSRTFLRLRITGIFMSAERERPSDPRHLRNESSLRRDFRREEPSARWDFPELFPTAAVTEFGSRR